MPELTQASYVWEKIALVLAAKVSLAGVVPNMLFATTLICSEYKNLEKECIITSATDGVHSRGSLHYEGKALDFRTRHLKQWEKEYLAWRVERALGEDFDVILEKTHLHVEYQPKLIASE